MTDAFRCSAMGCSRPALYEAFPENSTGPKWVILCDEHIASVRKLGYPIYDLEDEALETLRQQDAPRVKPEW